MEQMETEIARERKRTRNGIRKVQYVSYKNMLK
jgi:hypothetical protein